MGLYNRVILPNLLDWAMSSPVFSRYRQQVLANVEGEVLEIGFGTGLNLFYYPHHIKKVTTVDPNPGMNKLAQKRIEASEINVENRILTFNSFTKCRLPHYLTTCQIIDRLPKKPSNTSQAITSAILP